MNGSDPSLIAKSTPIVKEYCSIKWVDPRLSVLPFGTTYEPLEKSQGIFLLPSLISYVAAFRARTSALQDMERVWRESEADYFSRSCAWPKKSSQNLYFWKTSPLYAHEVGFESLEKLPKWGMIVGGVLYPLKNGSIKKEKGGFVLPNLMTSDSSRGPAKIYNKSGKQSSMRNLVTISYRIWKTGPLTPRVSEKLMGYPGGWTELEPWAMQWFLNKRKRLLKY
jgi:hypothetical protein